MKTILNLLRIRLNTLRLAGAAIARGIVHGLTHVKTVTPAKIDLMKEDGLEHCRLPFGIIVTRSGATFPVEIAWCGDEKGFEVAIMRNGVRSR